VRRVAGWVAAVLGLYPIAGLIGGAIPVGAASPPGRDVTIYVESNGVHTGFVVPVRAAGVDWSDLAPPDHLRDPRQAGWGWRAIGWGERGFYLETKSWADVRPGTTLHALVGSDRTVVHVEAIPEPRAAPDERPVMLGADAYRRLAAHVRASLAERPRRWPGYGDNDVFYEGRGRYDAIHDCNDWTGRGLRAAGVRMGAWTPFAGSVMAWL